MANRACLTGTISCKAPVASYTIPINQSLAEFVECLGDKFVHPIPTPPAQIPSPRESTTTQTLVADDFAMVELQSAVDTAGEGGLFH